MEILNEKAARNQKIASVIKIIVLIVLFICFIFPFFLVIINVFKTKADITMDPLARQSWVYAGKLPERHGEDEFLAFVRKLCSDHDRCDGLYTASLCDGSLCPGS